MQDSVGSWCTPQRGGTASYDKPVILDHKDEDSKQVIGRVRGASFAQIKHGDSFKYDFKNPDRGTSHGSGYIMLDTLILDPDAIPKILDGRYNTVSTGQEPSAARCSVCGFDWKTLKDADPCDHRPGRLYEIDEVTVPCFLVTGTLDYRECSYITVPGQPNAITVSSNLEALENMRSRDDEDGELVYTCIDAPASQESFGLCDRDGNTMDLILKDGEADILPDIATKFTKIAVSVPVEDHDMKKKDKSEKDESTKMTTDEADNVLVSWVDDYTKRTKDSPKDEKVEEDKDVTEPVKDKPTEPTQKDEPKKDTQKSQPISNDALSEAIDRVTGERNELKAEVEDLKTQIDEKTEVNTSLTEELTQKRQDGIVDAARQLALIRVITQHASASGADRDGESFEGYVTDLCKRSPDSLNDAIKDELPQLSDFMQKLKSMNTQNALSVDDPTLHRDADKKEDEQGEDDGNGKNENKLIDKNDYLDTF